jgi:hypothetical protein
MLDRMRRRVGAAAVLLATLALGPAGSPAPAAQAVTGPGDPVRVVHVEMRCHTVGDHEPIM